MASIVLAQLPQDTYVPPPMWQGITSWWEAPNGDIWNLIDGSSGIALCPGTRGFDNPEYDIYKETSPGMPGATMQGARAQSREVYWVLAIHQPDSPDAVLDLDSRFWDTMDPEAFGWWYVRTARGTRRLRIRFDNDNGHAWDHLPGTTEWIKYGIYLEATEQPYWQGEPVSVIYDPEDETDLFGDGAPDFNIGSGTTQSTATITNPGQTDAWATWRLDGPIEAGAVVGVGTRTTTVPVAVDAGKTLILNTNPRINTAQIGTWDESSKTLVGFTNVMREFGVTDFAPIPRGKDVPVTVSSVGSGTISASITPLYRRAW